MNKKLRAPAVYSLSWRAKRLVIEGEGCALALEMIFEWHRPRNLNFYALEIVNTDPNREERGRCVPWRVAGLRPGTGRPIINLA